MKLSKKEQIIDFLFIKSIYFYRFLIHFGWYRKLELTFIENLLKPRMTKIGLQTKLDTINLD